MDKRTITFQKDLKRGTILWVYADDHKVFRSSKRFDVKSFNDHDSTFIGTVEDVCSNKENESLVYDLLESTDRIFGVCLNDESQSRGSTKETSNKVAFFPSWKKAIDFANKHFKPVIKEKKRRAEAKRKWLQKGKQYMKKQNAKQQSMNPSN
ncbi:MAG TPA: hypothetical protein VK119_02510 [Bacillota bacterium]|nr:hypothetical protein [Bacillota bacterium]